jgi:hypothetical protein
MRPINSTTPKAPKGFPEFFKMLTLDEDDPFCVEKFPLCQGFKRWFITKYTVGLNGWMGKFGLENVLVIDMNDDEMTNAKKIISHVEEDYFSCGRYITIR